MLKRLAKCLGEYKKLTLLTPVVMTLEVVMEIIIPRIMTELIDNGLGKGSTSYIWLMGALLVLAAIAAMVFGALSGTFSAKAAAGFARNLRRDMYYNIQNFSFGNIDKYSTSSLVTRLTTDVTNVQMAFQMIIRMAVRCLGLLVLSVVMAVAINWRIALVFLVVIPLLSAGLLLVIRNVHPVFIRIFQTYDALNRVVQENLRGIRVVKSFVHEQHEKDKFNDISNTIFKDFTFAEKRLAFNAPIMQFCMYACLLAIAWMGAHYVVSDTMTTGALMSMISYAMQILMSLMFLSMVFVMTMISRASAERIVEILNEKSDLVNGSDAATKVRDGSISFLDVDFSYKNEFDKLCLIGVNLEIKPGETVGILGGTGSSKTSLVQLIPRLYDVTRGAVLVGGVDVRNYDIETLRNAVSVVLQKNVLFSGTVKENLRWGNANASDEELIRMCKLAQADGFIQEFPKGYDSHIEQGGSNVSGGQKQRLCIARALLKKPKILILDDSTSAVDTKTDALIRKALREEIPNTTKIIIAQRVASVQDADKIIVLDGGRVAAVGTHDELLGSSPIYSEVYHSQTRGGDFDESA